MKTVKLLIVWSCLIMIPASNILAQDLCEGDFDYDGDVDAADATVFRADYGRSQYTNPCPPNGPAAVPKTGQITSYAIGDDGDIEKGIAGPIPRFTDNGDGTVKDNFTGLIWLKNANCFGQRTWNLALSECNNLVSGMCGLTDGTITGDWRLPNLRELQSLVNYEYVYPAVPNTMGTGQWSENDVFINIQDEYWSSSSYSNGVAAWDISTYDGSVYSEPKVDAWWVWCVRGGR